MDIICDVGRKTCLELRPSHLGHQPCKYLGKDQVFLAARTAGAKALKQKWTWCVSETERRPTELQQSELQGREEAGEGGRVGLGGAAQAGGGGPSDSQPNWREVTAGVCL